MTGLLDELGVVGLLVQVLAVYRLTRFVTRDSLTAGLREWAMALHHAAATAREDGQGRWPLMLTLHRGSELLLCSWCLSVWVAAACAVVAHFVPDLWAVVALVLAVAAGAGLLLDRDAS